MADVVPEAQTGAHDSRAAERSMAKAENRSQVGQARRGGRRRGRPDDPVHDDEGTLFLAVSGSLGQSLERRGDRGRWQHAMHRIAMQRRSPHRHRRSDRSRQLRARLTSRWCARKTKSRSTFAWSNRSERSPRSSSTQGQYSRRRFPRRRSSQELVRRPPPLAHRGSSLCPRGSHRQSAFPAKTRTSGTSC